MGLERTRQPCDDCTCGSCHVDSSDKRYWFHRYDSQSHSSACVKASNERYEAMLNKEKNASQ